MGTSLPGPGRSLDLSRDWLFGGEYQPGSQDPGFDDTGFEAVTLPHTVVPLSWGSWDAASWQKQWIYRRHLDGAAVRGGRVLADFDGVMTSATVVLNGTSLGRHQGGYLPWSAELTGVLTDGDNVLAVIVDGSWQDVPPDGHPRGPVAVDYLQPAGIYREARLRVVPPVFLADVFARPADVLTARPSVAVAATIDAAVVPGGPVEVTAELLDGTSVLARAATTAAITAAGRSTARLTITGLDGIRLWSPDTPQLYTVRTRLQAPDRSGSGATAHELEVRTGFREAEFRLDGFYLNGSRLQLFGLNRHQLYPYLGMAAPARLQRRDAEILRNELRCNMVRCSHYPQSPHFLDACDELGLLVWEEAPGWQYTGGADFQDLVLRNVADLVIRDRSRPSVIVWGTRLNETASEVELYARTRRIADRLDGSRPTSGAMNRYDTAGWAQDVYAYDDYHCDQGRATLLAPLPGVPYLVAEAVGALDGPPLYRWTDTSAVLATQGRMHAEVHSIAGSDPGYAGLLGWCAFDYASLNGGERVWRNVKWPGVHDTFRVAKPGAAVYRAQADPRAAGPVILPMFFWDFGPGSPPDGPGPGAMVATNCERLEFFIAGRHVGTGYPDRAGYPGLAFPPVVADLATDGRGRPDLHVEGFLGGQRVASVTMSADTARDRLDLVIEDDWLSADGSDATRLTFRAVDRHGHQRPYVAGQVRLELDGPAVLIGDNPFPFGEYGGVGGGFIRSRPGQAGLVTVTAEHQVLGRAVGRLTIRPPAADRSRP